MSSFRTLGFVLALALVAGPVLADDLADVENPLKDAQAGEWTEYKVTYSNPMGGPEQEMPAKMTIVKVEGDNVDVKAEMELMGMPQESIQTLDKSASVLDMMTANLGAGMGNMANVKVVSSAVESLESFEHNGTTYTAAKKITVELSAEFSMGGGGPGMPVTVKATHWMSNEVPVTGAIKSESTVIIDMGGAPMEITAKQSLSGSGTGGAQSD